MSNLPDPLFVSRLGQRPVIDLLDELLDKGMFGFKESQGIRIFNEKEAVYAELASLLDESVLLLICSWRECACSSSSVAASVGESGPGTSALPQTACTLLLAAGSANGASR